MTMHLDHNHRPTYAGCQCFGCLDEDDWCRVDFDDNDIELPDDGSIHYENIIEVDEPDLDCLSIEALLAEIEIENLTGFASFTQ